MAGLLPRVEELLEHLVDEDSLPPWIHDLFIVRFFFELEDVTGEVLERTIEIGFEGADRPGARAGRRGGSAARQGSVEFRRLGWRTRDPQLRPATSVAVQSIEYHWLVYQRFVDEHR